ncbi:MAG: hypothetical protein Q7T74_06130, partial [Candidatus Saccharibacteria bacterium]|nr:hypothetical protein [Candidatus Saccharibacteria bacterium]
DPAQRMKNCAILQYTRVNPDDPSEIDSRLRWMRIIYPENLAKSPNGGKWTELSKPKYSMSNDLLKQADDFPSKIVDK